ncbi:MAG: 2-C-methyl-D-erythritol 4-phosphate cytidylyltransferase [Thermodesulfobacteriota bacterium]|nr:2-C-methyl-D-erythritol 4-phosphate cytidylyltransferase [Thermodesulfobacteriota bacterium]
MPNKKELSDPTKTVAIIPAAGSGVRMESPRSKQFLDLNGRPLLAVTMQTFQRCPQVDAFILVVPSTHVDYCRKEIVDKFNLDKTKKVVPGGRTRQDSVRLGLEAACGRFGLVLIHDGVRPVLDPAFIEKVIDAAKTHRAVITGIPAKETVKEVNGRQEVFKTHDRQRVWLVQTPQVFRYEDILAAHRQAIREGWEEATDDSTLIERLGITVKVVEGSEKNIKVTTPDDLELARFFLSRSLKPDVP